MKIVITDTPRHYRDFLKKNNLTSQEAIYVTSEEELKNLKGYEIVYYGKYWNNPLMKGKSKLLKVKEIKS